MKNLIHDIIKTNIGQIAENITDAYVEIKRLEQKKEAQELVIEEQKRKARRPIIIALAICTIIGLVLFWIMPNTPGIYVQLIGTVLLLPILIFLITKL